MLRVSDDFLKDSKGVTGVFSVVSVGLSASLGVRGNFWGNLRALQIVPEVFARVSKPLRKRFWGFQVVSGALHWVRRALGIFRGYFIKFHRCCCGFQRRYGSIFGGSVESQVHYMVSEKAFWGFLRNFKKFKSLFGRLRRCYGGVAGGFERSQLRYMGSEGVSGGF